jgi:hypothetical protein
MKELFLNFSPLSWYFQHMHKNETDVPSWNCQLYQAVQLPLVGQETLDLLGSSLGGQDGVKEMALLCLNEMFLCHV